LLVSSIEEGIAFSNAYAPEHLQLAFTDAEKYTSQIRDAGSVFVGAATSVVFGDYASGTNHTLPTNGTARAVGGVTVESFMKTISLQTVTSEGYSQLGPVVSTLARAEELEAHARAATIRSKRIND
jgi:histidinol dehydrogenase